MSFGCKRVKVKFPLTKEEAASFWAGKSFNPKKVGLKKRKAAEKGAGK